MCGIRCRLPGGVDDDIDTPELIDQGEPVFRMPATPLRCTLRRLPDVDVAHPDIDPHDGCVMVKSTLRCLAHESSRADQADEGPVHG